MQGFAMSSFFDKRTALTTFSMEKNKRGHTSQNYLSLCYYRITCHFILIVRHNTFWYFSKSDYRWRHRRAGDYCNQ